ncbi:ParB/RepB/Spo0J family partition protein [Kocuria sp. TGY1127_2]|uniref:ParB/RepB/Spo0J family partition protein n=1 Tax=Kocuria sp. TGY1127_2 TaxID=2711328 RepID=UPI00353031D0
MAERRRGLGRGLGSLIPTTSTENSSDAVDIEQPGESSVAKSVSRETSAPGASREASVSEDAPLKGEDTKKTSSRPARSEPKNKDGASNGVNQTKRTGTGSPKSAKDEPTKTSQNEANGTAKKAPAKKTTSEGRRSAASGESGAPSSGKGKNPSSDAKANGEKEGGNGAPNRKSGGPRADMGAALRKSSGGRRPVDFFFQPSESNSSSSEATNEGPRTQDNDGDAPWTQSEDKVSRETRKPQTASGLAEDHAQPSREANEADSSLIPVPGAYFGEIPVKDIHPNRKQPRQEFDEDEMEELVHSIREIGLLQPIVIRPSNEAGDEKYELVMGERRWRATQRAGLEKIPAIVRETQDVDLLRDALLENLHRSQLNPLEEAAAYQQLLNEFGTTQDELAARIGRSRPQISNTIRLLRLPALVQRRVAAGILSAGHARALLSLSDPAAMERLAQRIVAEGLSVRSVEEIIQSGGAEKGTQKPRKAATPSRHHERLDYIADAFSDKLDTSVKINLGARKGKMTIEFASVDDLNRIISVLDPEIERD